ncbi:MAG: DUF3107 domain-containing protein [Frankiaceae bacterium]
MEVKIGVQFAPREIVVETNSSQEEIESALAEALRTGGLFVVEDDRGRRVHVPADKVAYVEIGEQLERRVGFGTM